MSKRKPKQNPDAMMRLQKANLDKIPPKLNIYQAFEVLLELCSERDRQDPS